MNEKIRQPHFDQVNFIKKNHLPVQVNSNFKNYFKITPDEIKTMYGFQ